jgi:Ni,Fe-hydrogenase III large subunit/Ni,Fe-hydrogenase III component G
MSATGSQRQHIAVVADELADRVGGYLAEGYRLALVAGHDDGDGLRIVYLLTSPPSRQVELTLHLTKDSLEFPSLATRSFPAGRFEREMHDLFGVVPQGHPLPRRLVRHPHWPAGWYPLRRDAGPPPPFTDAEPYPFLTVEGQGVYEIPVGPVHAGLIEPGHFRFSVVGETILKLKIRLWFAHRGIEKLFEGRDAMSATGLAERISGDTSAGHALAYSLAVEDALAIQMPEQSQLTRCVLIELERLYNHVADLGALANDVGYGIANAHALRIRERLLRINADVTGHRLLRDAIIPGSVTVANLPNVSDLREIAVDVQELTTITLANSVVKDRFSGTAVLGLAQAQDLGCLGPVARASGLAVDARIDHPVIGLPIHPVLGSGGDVLARYQVRSEEVRASVDLLTTLIPELSTGTAAGRMGTRTDGGAAGVGIVEGWRGTIVHRVEVKDGIITRVKAVDPSWFNWPALPVALANTIVPDFPLTNKSFNLSYAGNDL